MSWKEAFRKEVITETVDRDAVAQTPEPERSAIAGSIEQAAPPDPHAGYTNLTGAGTQAPAPDPTSALEMRLDTLEARIKVLESPTPAKPAPSVPYGLVELPPAGIPVNQVTPPTGALVVKGIHYRDAVCDECGLVHDGTGRTMDTRGKLIKNPKKCSQQ